MCRYTRCDAEFYSDYDEFGMTSVEDILFHYNGIEESNSLDVESN